MYIETTEKLLDFIEKSPTAFQTVDEMQKRLTENGFEVLSEKEYWKLVPGGKYLVTRNNSALIAFCIPEKESRVFHIMASHSDSPSFKIKENPEIKVDNSYVKLNVEKYGGMLMAPWFDRPLSVAGRVIIRRNGGLKEKLINIKRDLVMIPNLAIHMNREANNGVLIIHRKTFCHYLQREIQIGHCLKSLLNRLALKRKTLSVMICFCIIVCREPSGGRIKNLFHPHVWMICSVHLPPWKDCSVRRIMDQLQCIV